MKTYEIKIHKKANKFFEKLSPKIKKSLDNWLDAVAFDPHNANDGRMINFYISECKSCPVYKKRIGQFVLFMRLIIICF